MTFWAKFNRLLAHRHLPSLLSIFRGFLGIFLPFLLFCPDASMHALAFALFVFGSLTDYWDGWLARRYGHVSDFGKIIDPTMDKLLILAPLVAFVKMDLYSVWWAVPFFVREITVTFCRIGWLLEGKAIGAEKLGKLKFGIQSAMIIVSFLVVLAKDFSFPAFLASFFTGLNGLLLVTGVFLTVLSGLTFFAANRKNFSSREFAKFTAACGVGLSPKAPGTCGTLLGAILIPLVSWNPALFWLTFLFFLVAGYWAVSRLDLSAAKDPQYVVVDEVLGMFLTMAFVPATFINLIVGFCFFRLFDIVKPPPARQFEKFPGYWGIVCDDLAAGLYAGAVLLFITRL